MDFRLFIPLTKVDVEKRLVFGTLAEEIPDRAGEIMDYESARPEFEKWSSDIEAASDGRSVGNLRAMHGQVEANTNRLETEEAAKWTQLSNSIRSSFNSAIDGMLFQGKTFLQGMLAIAEGVIKAFLEMGEKIAEDWIQRQIESLFMTESVQATTATTEVTTQAGIAAATAYAQYAAFPPVAEAMAAEAFAATMAWGMPKLAMGAWDLKSDMVAELHRGEMVVPENFASGLRANGGGFGGGDVHMNYSPTLHAREPASLAQMLVSESSAMLAWLRRQMRNGAIGMA